MFLDIIFLSPNERKESYHKNLSVETCVDALPELEATPSKQVKKYLKE
jgi:hypothetical protein